VAETGRSCWGSGQQDASGSEADAGSRNPGSGTALAVTERLSSSPSGGAVTPAARLRVLREFVENARQKREEFVKVIKMRRRY